MNNAHRLIHHGCWYVILAEPNRIPSCTVPQQSFHPWRAPLHPGSAGISILYTEPWSCRSPKGVFVAHMAGQVSGGASVHSPTGSADQRVHTADGRDVLCKEWPPDGNPLRVHPVMRILGEAADAPRPSRLIWLSRIAQFSQLTPPPRASAIAWGTTAGAESHLRKPQTPSRQGCQTGSRAFTSSLWLSCTLGHKANASGRRVWINLNLLIPKSVSGAEMRPFGSLAPRPSSKQRIAASIVQALGCAIGVVARI